MQRYDEELYFSLPPTDVAFIDNLFIECRLLHEVWKKLDKNIIFIHDDNELFSDDYDIVVGDDEVKDLLELNALRNSSSELYLWYFFYLYSIFDKTNLHIFFVVIYMNR